MLPCGKPQGPQRTIRQTGFYFQLFLSNIVHSGEISASCRTFLVFLFFAYEAVKMSWMSFLVLLVSKIPHYGFVALTTSLPLGFFSSNSLKHGKQVETYIPAGQGWWKGTHTLPEFLG